MSEHVADFRTGSILSAVLALKYLSYLRLWKVSLTDLSQVRAARQQLLYDLASGLDRPTNPMSSAEARNGGYTRDDGRFTDNSLQFARGMLTIDGGARLLQLRAVIINYELVRPILYGEMWAQMEMGGQYGVHSALKSSISRYACNSPDILARLLVEANCEVWQRPKQLIDWVGYAPTDANIVNGFEQ